MSRKTITVVSAKSGKVYWKYHDMNNRAKEYYHSTAKHQKCKHSFIKSLENLRIPHDGSLKKYGLSHDDIYEIIKKKISEDPARETMIKEHFTAIIDRIHACNSQSLSV